MKNLRWFFACIVTFFIGLSFSTTSEKFNNIEDESIKSSINDNQKIEDITTNEKEQLNIDTKDNVESENIYKNNTIDSISKQDIKKQEIIIEKPVEKPIEYSIENYSDVKNNLNKSLIKIGNYTLLDNYEDLKNEYKNYYCYDSLNSSFFNDGGKSGYGNFLLTVDHKDNIIQKISYSQWSNNSLNINIGNINIGDDLNNIIKYFGSDNKTLIEYDVKQLVYSKFTYNNKPINLIFYLDSKTNKIYGFEIFFIN